MEATSLSKHYHFLLVTQKQLQGDWEKKAKQQDELLRFNFSLMGETGRLTQKTALHFQLWQNPHIFNSSSKGGELVGIDVPINISSLINSEGAAVFFFSLTVLNL